MIPRNCHVKHNPPYQYADCVRACVATMIDRDDVPHVFDGRAFDKAWQDLRIWLRIMYGKTLSIFPTEDHAEFMKENNPGTAYMLLCSASSGGDHAIICRDGARIHDPAWYKSAEYKQHSLGCYFICIIGDAF